MRKFRKKEFKILVALALIVVFGTGRAEALIRERNVDDSVIKQSYHFATTDVSSGLSDASVYIAGTPDTNPAVWCYAMPYDGDVRAVAAYCNGTISAGQCTFNVTINGTETDLVADFDSTTDTITAYGTQGVNKDEFSAGDRLGLTIYTTDGTAGTTAFDSSEAEAPDFSIVVIVGHKTISP